MSIIANYKKGIAEAAVRPKTILLLWLINLGFAFPAYLLFSTFFGGAIGRSGLAQDLMAKLDMNVLFEVLTTSGRPLGMLISGIMALVLTYFLVTIFLPQGLVRLVQELLRSPEGVRQSYPTRVKQGVQRVARFIQSNGI